MYSVEKRSDVLENAAGFVRLDMYICNNMAALRYVYTLG